MTTKTAARRIILALALLIGGCQASLPAAPVARVTFPAVVLGPGELEAGEAGEAHVSREEITALLARLTDAR